MNELETGGGGFKLSRRLSTLAEWVPEGARFADIGTDHALLPVFLARSGKITYAVAGDVHAGPVEAAKRQVAEAGLEDVVSVRLGDGMSVLSPGEVDTVAIAGMGGSLMVRILEQSGERLKGVETLILSPHVAEEAVRRWLVQHQYILEQEMLLEEEGIIYTLLRAIRMSDAGEFRSRHSNLYNEGLLAPKIRKMSAVWLYEMGPHLLRNPTRAFHVKWEEEIAKRERVIAQLSYSSTSGAAEKAREWEEDVREIREVLSCLPAEKPSSN
ncbi:tRNA (adenine(22)-N(1))-methyltransferase TrmK [Cohnella sp.]|uniref:tRNA (adenine(22)-N(1))-methyltransferase n=1 Tax=Cohnella sp. TaxID=1883426 RepID=UPI0035691F81